MKNNHEIILKQYAAYCKEQPLYLGTAGSYGMEMLTIIREGVWAEYDILAAFHPPVGAAVQVRVGANNQIGVPIEATAEKGMGEIVFAGYKEGVRQIAVDVLYKVAPSSGASGTEPAEPTPDVVQQILSAASNAEEIAQSMQPAAAAATSAAAAATSAAAAATSAAAEATEAMAAAQKAETMEVLQAAYKRACEELNEEDAAAFARKIRDKLLCDTDNRVALDRFNISVPSSGTFTAWLAFLKSLGGIITGAWATYRQELRDLPQQEGFPFNITFPVPPADKSGTEQPKIIKEDK